MTEAHLREPSVIPGGKILVNRRADKVDNGLRAKADTGSDQCIDHVLPTIWIPGQIAERGNE